MRCQRQHCARRTPGPPFSPNPCRTLHTPAAGRGVLAVRSAAIPFAAPFAAILFSVTLVATILFAAPLQAQQRNRENSDVINPVYFRAFNALYSGEYENALDGFRDAGRGAIRTVDARWIDSICYHAMTGEVYYQTGQHAKALEHFTSALQLYVQYPDWMMTVQFPPTIGPRTAAVGPVPWGQSQRRFRLGQFPERFNISRSHIGIGQLDGKTVAAQQSTLQPLHAAELVRCTALAIQRHAELLGPVAAQDRLTLDVLAKLATRPGPPNHWTDAWIDLQLGMALSATGRTAQAVTTLEKSLVAATEFDHPLTGVAELELGRIALNKGDYKTAASWFAEASCSGFYFSRPEIVEEALYYGSLVHILTQGQGVYPPLAAAADWARVHHLRTMQTSLQTMLAENYCLQGDARQAAAVLSLASHAMARRDLAASSIGARLNYVTAMLNYQRHQPKAAEVSLAAALAFQKTGSLKLFQMGMVDQFYREGTIRDRQALDLYGRTLDEPSAADWQQNPLDALTVLVTPQDTLLEHWLDAALQLNDVKTAVEVTDRIRRRRFYNTLPLGGRLLSLRWVLEAPEAALDKKALAQRTELLARYGHYKDLSKQSEKIMADLKQEPPISDDRAVATRQGKLLSDLARVSMMQEATIEEMALRREAIEMLFPPQRTLADVQQGMRPGQAILTFLVGRRDTYAFLITPERFGGWKIASLDAIKKRLGSTLRAMGQYDQGRELDTTALKDQSWRGEAAALLKEILQGSKVDLGIGIQELIVVPDDVFWYVPFEVLQVGKANQTDVLISRMRVRYAPTVGLAVPDGRARRQGGATGVLMGKLYPHEPDEISDEAFKRIHRAVPQAAIITHLPVAPSSLLAKRLDSLVVFDDLTGSDEQNPYQLRPMRLDRGRPGGSLEDWFSLPFGGPDIVALPGFHTPAENGLKKFARNARPGDELFLTLCGVMSTGTRTVLISRWRTGGRTCFELISEMLQELPNTSAADAWQRAVEVARQTPLDFSLEPRVKAADREAGQVLADHPFFWGGYMLVDTGTDPRPKPAPQPQQPQLKFPGKN